MLVSRQVTSILGVIDHWTDLADACSGNWIAVIFWMCFDHARLHTGLGIIVSRPLLIHKVRTCSTRPTAALGDSNLETFLVYKSNGSRSRRS